MPGTQGGVPKGGAEIDLCGMGECEVQATSSIAESTGTPGAPA